MLSIKHTILIAKCRAALDELAADVQAVIDGDPTAHIVSDRELANPYYLPPASLSTDELLAIKQRQARVLRARYSPEQLQAIGAKQRAGVYSMATAMHKAAMGGETQDIGNGPSDLGIVTMGPGDCGLSPAYAAAIRHHEATRTAFEASRNK